MAEVRKAGGISSQAVRARTGKGWDEWFAILDTIGAREMGHQKIVSYLAEKHGVPGWWCQMVTVAYEQERGLRQKHQTPRGFQASASKTIAVSVERLFQAWSDPQVRRQWLGDEAIVIRKATPSKSLRITWSDGRTSVDVNLYPKGHAKSQVSLQHEKLASDEEVARVKAYWAQTLERLKALLEG